MTTPSGRHTLTIQPGEVRERAILLGYHIRKHEEAVDNIVPQTAPENSERTIAIASSVTTAACAVPAILAAWFTVQRWRQQKWRTAARKGLDLAQELPFSSPMVSRMPSMASIQPTSAMSRMPSMLGMHTALSILGGSVCALPDAYSLRSHSPILFADCNV